MGESLEFPVSCLVDPNAGALHADQHIHLHAPVEASDLQCPPRSLDEPARAEGMTDLQWTTPFAASAMWLAIAIIGTLFLGEEVATQRWVGIGAVLAGVLLIVQS